MDIMEIIDKLGVAVVPVLVITSFGVGMVAKAIKAIPNECIPVICCCAGGAFGVIAFYVGVDGVCASAGEWFTALAIGMASGLAATGLHQVYKQLSGDGIDYKTGYFNALEEKAVLLKQMEEQELKEIATTEAVAEEVE